MLLGMLVGGVLLEEWSLLDFRFGYCVKYIPAALYAAASAARRAYHAVYMSRMYY